MEIRSSTDLGAEPRNHSNRIFDEHLDSNPIHITTRSERRQIMSRNNLEYHDVSKKRRGRIYSFMGGK